MSSPIIMSHRKADTSRLLAQLVTLVRDFDHWETTVEAKAAARPPA
jgi:hypothetical protein